MTTKEIKEMLQFFELCNPSIVHKVESLRIKSYNSRIDIELRHTKSNRIMIDGDLCKPIHIEVWKKSGNCTLWFSRPRGKSFSQYSFPTEIKIIKE